MPSGVIGTRVEWQSDMQALPAVGGAALPTAHAGINAEAVKKLLRGLKLAYCECSDCEYPAYVTDAAIREDVGEVCPECSGEIGIKHVQELAPAESPILDLSHLAWMRVRS